MFISLQAEQNFPPAGQISLQCGIIIIIIIIIFAVLKLFGRLLNRNFQQNFDAENGVSGSFPS